MRQAVNKQGNIKNVRYSDVPLISITAYPNPILNQAAKFRQPPLNLDGREDKQLPLVKVFQYP